VTRWTNLPISAPIVLSSLLLFLSSALPLSIFYNTNLSFLLTVLSQSVRCPQEPYLRKSTMYWSHLPQLLPAVSTRTLTWSFAVPSLPAHLSPQCSHLKL
jgi:hypothetical protein